jgi:hypothetical protein
LILFITIQVLYVGCHKDQFVPSILSEHIESQHFDYYYDPLDTLAPDTSWQERYFEWLIQETGLIPSQKFVFLKYMDREQLYQLTGRDMNAFAESNHHTLHTIWPVDNHECVHILVNNAYGFSPALFDEGIAVAHQATLQNGQFVPGWNGEDFHAICRQFVENDALPGLEQILENDDFWKIDPAITYPVSGSFCRFLLDRYGVEPYFGLIDGLSLQSDQKKIKSEYTKIFGASIVEDWDSWQTFIAEYE